MGNREAYPRPPLQALTGIVRWAIAHSGEVVVAVTSTPRKRLSREQPPRSGGHGPGAGRGAPGSPGPAPLLGRPRPGSPTAAGCLLITPDADELGRCPQGRSPARRPGGERHDPRADRGAAGRARLRWCESAVIGYTGLRNRAGRSRTSCPADFGGSRRDATGRAGPKDGVHAVVPRRRRSSGRRTDRGRAPGRAVRRVAAVWSRSTGPIQYDEAADRVSRGFRLSAEAQFSMEAVAACRQDATGPPLGDELVHVAPLGGAAVDGATSALRVPRGAGGRHVRRRRDPSSTSSPDRMPFRPCPGPRGRNAER